MREVRAGAQISFWKQELKQKPGMNTAYWIGPQPAVFSSRGPGRSVSAHSVLDPHTSTINQEKKRATALS